MVIQIIQLQQVQIIVIDLDVYQGDDNNIKMGQGCKYILIL